MKKNNNNYGSVFIGVQLANKSNIYYINNNLIKYKYNFQKIYHQMKNFMIYLCK